MFELCALLPTLGNEMKMNCSCVDMTQSIARIGYCTGRGLDGGEGGRGGTLQAVPHAREKWLYYIKLD